jgi:hypothetical protein
MAYDAIRAWQQANKGNSTVQAAANDLFYNALSSNLSTQSAVSYANQMTPIALRYQQASTKIAEEVDLRRLGAETSAIRGLTQQQGDLNYRDNQLAAQTTRYGADRELEGRLADSAATKYVANRVYDATVEQTKSQRYGYDQALKGTGLQTAAQRYESDRATDRTGMETSAQRYGYDRQLEGTKDTNRSDEDKIRISGGQDRKTLTRGTDETLRLRADARGAIRTAGKSFYG